MVKRWVSTSGKALVKQNARMSKWCDKRRQCVCGQDAMWTTRAALTYRVDEIKSLWERTCMIERQSDVLNLLVGVDDCRCLRSSSSSSVEDFRLECCVETVGCRSERGKKGESKGEQAAYLTDNFQTTRSTLKDCVNYLSPSPVLTLRWTRPVEPV